MKLEIYDTTLRDGEQGPYNWMNPSQKLGLALNLKDLGVDIIESGFPASNPDDYNAVYEISRQVKDVAISALARARKGDIDKAASALEHASDPMVHVFLPASKLHIEKKLGLDYDNVYDLACEMIGYAKGKVGRVIFGAEDASRAEPGYLSRLMNGVADAGAEMFVFADTVGYLQPGEIFHLINSLYKARISNGRNEKELIKLGIHCHNDLGQAVTNTLESIRHGVSHIQTTLLGIGERAGNAAIEQIIMALECRPDYFENVHTHEKIEHHINLIKLVDACEYLADVIGLPIPRDQPVLGSNCFRHSSGIHAHGIIIDPKTYEVINPQLIGRQTSIMIGKHTGKHGRAYVKEHSMGDTSSAISFDVKRNLERMNEFFRRVRGQNEVMFC
ncbi:MAG: 2-isopropylmalate synthase [Candidatus Woesearchaeota archaeon]